MATACVAAVHRKLAIARFHQICESPPPRCLNSGINGLERSGREGDRRPQSHQTKIRIFRRMVTGTFLPDPTETKGSVTRD